MCPVPCAHRDARIFVQRDGNQHFCSFTSKQWNSAAKHENSVDRMRQGKFRGAKIFRYTSKLPRLTIQRNNKSFGSTFFCIWQRFRCSHEIKLMQKIKNLHLWRKKTVHGYRTKIAWLWADAFEIVHLRKTMQHHCHAIKTLLCIVGDKQKWIATSNINARRFLYTSHTKFTVNNRLFEINRVDVRVMFVDSHW